MIGLNVTAVSIILVAVFGLWVPISNHNGAVIVDWGLPCFQLNGVIWGGYSEHEYMHYEQQQERGDNAYYSSVVIPSIAANLFTTGYYMMTGIELLGYERYYELPWEH